MSKLAGTVCGIVCGKDVNANKLQLGSLLNYAKIPADYSHPMLPIYLKIKYIGNKAVIDGYTIDSFRKSISSPIIKYVNGVTGSDSANGDTRETAYKTFNKAHSVNCDRIILIEPLNYYTLQTKNNITASLEIISENGISQIFKGVSGDIRTWVDDGGGMYHTTAFSLAPQGVYDSKYSTDDIPARLSVKLNSSEVAAQAGTYYKDAGANILYVHCSDNRQPDNDVSVVTDFFYCGNLSTDVHFYLENVSTFGLIVTNGGVGILHLNVKNSIFHHRYGVNCVGIYGNCQSFLKRCTVSKTDMDCISYKIHNLINSCGIEDELTVLNSESVSSTSINNASTAHDECTVLRLNSNYNNTEGPIVHDVNSSKSLNVNCNAGESYSTLESNRSAFAVASGSSETAKMWLENCTGGSVTTFGAENRAVGTAHIYARKSRITNVEPGTTVESY